MTENLVGLLGSWVINVGVTSLSCHTQFKSESGGRASHLCRPRFICVMTFSWSQSYSKGFSLGETPVSPLGKSDSQLIPSGCRAVLRGHSGVMFSSQAPSWLHSSFGPTSLSCAKQLSLWLRERAISRSDMIWCDGCCAKELLSLINLSSQRCTSE